MKKGLWYTASPISLDPSYYCEAWYNIISWTKFFSTTINYQWNQHQHNQTCANHHHHHLYFLCKGSNKVNYLHQHRRQYIIADFSGSCSCQFALDTWMVGASNQDVIWCRCSCIWKALCKQNFVLYVCFPTQFSWTHWWRVWEQCRFSFVHLITAVFYIFKKLSWCWWGERSLGAEAVPLQVL